MTNKDQTDFDNWLSQQTKSLPEPEVSSEFLAAQRRSIYRRLDLPQRNWMSMRWAFSLALLLVMVAGGLTIERRHRTAPPISDEQLFSDLSALEQSNEPKAIQPMHGLFQE